DLAGQLRHQPQFGRLIVVAEVVAFVRAGEAALRAEAALVEIDVGGRLVDTPLDDVLGFQLREFAADQAEHHGFFPGHEAQRAEVAGARVVVLEEEDVDGGFVEHHFRHRLVAAFGCPGAAMVATAQVDAHAEIVRAALDAVGDQPRVERRQLVRILAQALDALAVYRVAQIGQVGVVELDVTAAVVVEVLDLLVVNARQVFEEAFHVGVGLLVDAAAPAAEMQHGGRRNADLGHEARRHDGLEEVEVLDGNTALRAGQFTGDVENGRRQGDLLVAAAELDFVIADGGGDAVQLFQKVDVEEGPPLLTVGDASQAGVLLHLGHFTDGIVLDGAQLFRADPAFLEFRARLAQRRRTQQAADMVRSEWWISFHMYLAAP